MQDMADYGVMLLGPLMNCFCAVLLNHARGGERPSIGFISREGVFMQRAFQAFCEVRDENLPSFVIPASRAFLSRLLLQDGILEMVSQSDYEGTFADFLSDRFALDDPALSGDRELAPWLQTHLSLPREGARLQALWSRVAPHVTRDLASKSEAYREHLFGLGLTDRTLISDLGYSGSLQSLLGWLQRTPLDGFYVAAASRQKIYVKEFTGGMAAMFPDLGTMQSGSPLLRNSLLFEVMMSADHGQVDDFSDAGADGVHRFRYGPDGKTQQAHMLIRVMQDAAIDFIRSAAHVPMASLSAQEHIHWMKRYTQNLASMPRDAPRVLRAIGDVDDRTSGLGFVNPWTYLPRFVV